jgi:hypothetical protein
MMTDLVKELHEVWNQPWVGVAGRTIKSMIVRGVVPTAIDLVKGMLGFHNEITDGPGAGFEQRWGQTQAPSAQGDFAEKLKKLGLERAPPSYSKPAGLLSGPIGSYTGDDQIPGVSKGWEWMRKSNDIEDRRQVDNSLRQGDEYVDFIKANTAETKRLNDNFKLLDRGEAVLKGLGGLPGFESGKDATGGMYGGGGATGGWTTAAPPVQPNGSDVGSGDGKGAGDSHPTTGKGGGTSEQSSASPVEQSNPASASTSVPQRFVSDLTAMTLAGAKPHNIHAYMLQHGINLSEATCGQFMSSVVKEHGGVPPKNPAVASNWNTFGGVQGAGYSADPNAINIAVKQGTSTGSTGSHVTSAVPITDESGKVVGFRGVGVNQGKQGVSGVGQYGRDVVTSIPLRIGSRPGEYQIRHEIIKPTDDRQTIDQASADKQVRTVKVETGGKLTADVNAPAGSDVKVEGGGAFSKTETNRTMPLQ